MWVCQAIQYMDYEKNRIGSSKVPNLPWVMHGTYVLIPSVLPFEYLSSKEVRCMMQSLVACGEGVTHINVHGASWGLDQFALVRR